MSIDTLRGGGARGSVDNTGIPQPFLMGAGVANLGIVALNREVWSFSLQAPVYVWGLLDVAIGSHGWYVIRLLVERGK